MSEKRYKPYVWVTWITKLLAGESHCRWSAWFRANYKYSKLPSDFSFAKWKAEHSELVSRRAKELRDAGYTVKLEDQNAFKLDGRNGVTLAGKPDLIAFRTAVENDKTTTWVLISDAKTGQVRDSDCAQVNVYRTIAPVCWPAWGAPGVVIEGEVVYKDQVLAVPFDPGFKERLRGVMDMLAGAPPERVAAGPECRFCDIGQEDCPDRVTVLEEELATAAGGHDLF